MAPATRASRKGPKVTPKMMQEVVDHPREDIPYFNCEPLNRNIYPAKYARPVAPVPDCAYLQNAKRALSESSVEPESGSEEEREIEANINYTLNAQGVLPAAAQATPEQSNGSIRANKRVKVEGGRPAVSKKVKADMDSDDELLWRLKLAKWTEKEIHARFLAEGRIGYCQKTIGTRYCRQKKVMKEHMDQLLEEGKADWHEGDDNALRQAVMKADEQIQKMLQQIEKRKWELVSEHLKELKPVTNYSSKACRNRWEAHMNGTATIPLEHRPNPDEQTVRNIQTRRAEEALIRELERMPR
ncbi:hypothetical protein VTN00DRAFT_8364 [Thermoascus crustaceus]|uniref:uncharacterized protein n=1 Tax=Thermoascus crustaceus TaxID=5088 RepID=UPI003743C075